MKMERKPDKKNAFLESKDMYKYFFQLLYNRVKY